MYVCLKCWHTAVDIFVFDELPEFVTSTKSLCRSWLFQTTYYPSVRDKSDIAKSVVGFRGDITVSSPR